MTRMEWQRQRAEDDVVRQIMRTHVLEARAQIDTVEDTGSSYHCGYFVSKQIMYDSTLHYEALMYDVMVDLIFHDVVVIMPVTRQGTNDAMTLESIQAMIDRAIQRNSTHTQDDASHNLVGGLRRPVQPARVCSYPDFMKCQPLNFKGTKGIVGLSQWIEKMELNGHMRTLGHDAAYAMTWGTFKKKLIDKYCPNDEIKKLEIELWNLKVRGNDVAAYTHHFQELALMCTKFLANETAKIDKYIGGLPDNIHGNVMFARPKTLNFAIELAKDLMDQKLRTYAKRQNENKKRLMIRQETITNNNPTRSRIQCVPKCGKCKRYGHATTDCQVNTNNNNKNQKAGACYECGNIGHMRRDCPKLKNRGNGNGNGIA
ncbi:reverse transcriptase domain-containing protein [Tanacetum coccineum]